MSLAYNLLAPLPPIPRPSNKQGSDPNKNLVNNNFQMQQYQQALRKVNGNNNNQKLRSNNSNQKLRPKGITILTPMPQRTNKSPRGNHRNTSANHRNTSANHRNTSANHRNTSANHRNTSANHRNTSANQNYLSFSYYLPTTRGSLNKKGSKQRKPKAIEGGILQPYLSSKNNSKNNQRQKELCMAYLQAVMKQSNQYFNATNKSGSSTATTVSANRICEFIHV